MLIQVRIIRYKAVRGRPAGTESAIVNALAIMWQSDGSLVVELQERAFYYKKGYDIAIWPQNIISKIKLNNI